MWRVDDKRVSLEGLFFSGFSNDVRSLSDQRVSLEGLSFSVFSYNVWRVNRG